MATQQLAFRLPDEDVQAIDLLARRLTAQRMGLETNRTEALVVMIRAGARALGVPHAALDALDENPVEPPPPAPNEAPPPARPGRRKPRG